MCSELRARWASKAPHATGPREPQSPHNLRRGLDLGQVDHIPHRCPKMEDEIQERGHGSGEPPTSCDQTYTLPSPGEYLLRQDLHPSLDTSVPGNPPEPLQLGKGMGAGEGPSGPKSWVLFPV